ncbi:unnamed protein product [Rotaria sordida]|uniref:Potassium channel tetramerisation-type BTB domain-containing protein n=1 Tax=Rotaria sordida TaxID=392033 RepID=A0A814X608_9BILA|nr:unnamed protein product [Rotaria sordida]CAF1492952.1 unnamed protein product [Rotaria sordida]
MTSNPVQKTNETTDNKDVVVSNDTSTQSSSKVQTKLMSRFCISIDDDPIILLNIGGIHMSTRRSTLMCIPNTVLALACTNSWSEKITHDNDGRLFFDCDPNLFQFLLNQLREWSSSTRKVFELPRNEYDRQRFRLLCYQFNFHRDLIDGIHRHEKFHKLCGHILLDEHSSVAIHAGNYRYGECRGINVYSSGINRIILRLKHDSMEQYNTFIGIIWSSTPMQERSFESPTAYGWAGGKQVYLRGIPSCIQGYGGYDSDMCTNDTIELILNCQLSFISILNHRTKKLYQIPIDTREGCPFPWQLHINLCEPDDRVKIVNPT